MSRADAAKKTLTHYFRVVFEAAGIKWSSDNETEVREIIDDIIEASKYPIATETTRHVVAAGGPMVSIPLSPPTMPKKHKYWCGYSPQDTADEIEEENMEEAATEWLSDQLSQENRFWDGHEFDVYVRDDLMKTVHFKIKMSVTLKATEMPE